MAKHDDQVALRQMRDAAGKALIVVGGHLRPDLGEDWIGALALMQLLQIIWEAARRVSDTFRQDHPEIAWAQIIGATEPPDPPLRHGGPRPPVAGDDNGPPCARDCARPNPRLAELTMLGTIDQLIPSGP